MPPSGFALVDGDKGKPAENPDTPQRHVPFIQLKCHEAENLFLTDEVLQAMGLTWPEAQTKILAAAATKEFGQKADALTHVATVDRQHGDIKAVIEQLSYTGSEKFWPE
jgi:hypothetical protein